MTIRLSNNETIHLALENGLFTYTIEGKVIPVTLPRITDGYWHNIEIKYMTAEIWFSLDFGQHEITIPLEAKVQGLFVSQVIVGGLQGDAFSGCVQVIIMMFVSLLFLYVSGYVCVEKNKRLLLPLFGKDWFYNIFIGLAVGCSRGKF